uniref:Membrane-spanning 4-domains subfamily A member 4A-like n=1 Tax=Astyanax mexicanus TaxID=7994 RepID=A0A3B1IJ29_ASTMX
MSTPAVPDSNTQNGFTMVTHLIPPSATVQNGAMSGVPTAGVPTAGVPTAGVPTFGVPTFGVPTAGVPTAGVHYFGGPAAGVPTFGVPTFGVPSVGVPSVGVPNGVPNVKLGKFLKIQPKALGTVQILTGVITLVFGIVQLFGQLPFSVFSGIYFWGSLIYISAGSLSVSAEKKLNSCLVKASLIMNVFSAITAAVAILMLSLDFVVQTGYDPCYYPYNNYEACQAYLQFLSRTQGISGVLLVFSLLQFIISICVSAFGCKATCCNDPMVSVVTVAPTPAACCSLTNPFYAPSRPQDVFYIANPNVNVNNTPTQNPPAYVPNSQKPDE